MELPRCSPDLVVETVSGEHSTGRGLREVRRTKRATKTVRERTSLRAVTRRVHQRGDRGFHPRRQPRRRSRGADDLCDKFGTGASSAAGGILSAEAGSEGRGERASGMPRVEVFALPNTDTRRPKRTTSRIFTYHSY